MGDLSSFTDKSELFSILACHGYTSQRLAYFLQTTSFLFDGGYLLIVVECHCTTVIQIEGRSWTSQNAVSQVDGKR